MEINGVTYYWIDGEWLTWEETHALGYTRRPAIELPCVDGLLYDYTVRKDPDDGTFYDEDAQEWYSSLENLGLYFPADEVTLYRGETLRDFAGYTQTEGGSTTHVASYEPGYGEMIVSIEYMRETYGYTDHPCEPYIVIGGVVVAWYDSERQLYWDDREGAKAWTPTPPEVKGGDEFFGTFKCTLQMIDIDISSMILDP